MARLEDLLASAQAGDPEVQDTLAKLRTFHQKRFWHEFSEQLIHLVYQQRSFPSQPLLEAALAELSVYMDPLIIVELIDALLSRVEAPLEKKLSLINEAKEILSKNELAQSYLKVVEARARISAGDLEEGLKVLKEAEVLIEAFRSVPKVIYASMNSSKALYYWKKADIESFQTSISQFLAYSDEKKLSVDEQVDIAERTLVSALLSDNVLLFGDFLVSNFFAKCAEKSDKKHLWSLAEIFNSGNVEQLEQFLVDHNAEVSADPLLGINLDKLRRKVRVIAIYDAIFFSQKSFLQQNVTFAEICGIAKIQKSQVERLIVHVLSIGLLQGYIDEVDELFFITGLKAQELDKTRLSQLKDKYDSWNENIKGALDFVNKC